MLLVRGAQLRDAERLLQIYSHYVKHTAISFEYEPPSLAEFRQRMQTTLRRYPYLVAERDGRVEGYAYAGPFGGRAAYDWACETTIYLDRSAQKCGLGRALYGALEKTLQSMGVLNLYACIAWPQTEDEYLTQNSAGFHAHLGYVKVGEFHQCGYKFGRWYDVIWMEKLLKEHALAAPVTPYPQLAPAAGREG